MKNIKKFLVVLLIVILSIGLIGCEELDENLNLREDSGVFNNFEEDTEEKLIEGKNSDSSVILGDKGNDNGKIRREVELNDFTFIVEYSINPSLLKKWKIIDRKNIKMSAWTENLPEGWEVLIKHVHADMYILNSHNKYPSLKQDSMDDKYHGFSQDGFYINNEEKYESVFSVDPVNETLLSGWKGYVSESYLTEYNLELRRYFANELFVVYDLLIKRPGDSYYHTKSISQPVVILKPNYLEVIN